MKKLSRDNLTPAQRSYAMSQVRSKDTSPELAVRRALFRRGLRFRKHRRDLPGTPDIVFVTAKVAVFVDGEFWHGYQFARWRDKLSDYWRARIERNIRRDRRAHRHLRRLGWVVVRVWQREFERESAPIVNAIELVVRDRLKPRRKVG
ncbi:MAG TPA: very short patch repair endonuclease [Thermoanaerobaculia bacterium]|jgi:DNA mismatch endonuclease (patch repair protein)